MFLDILIIFSESAVGPLIQKLTQLWTQFQTSISSDLSDYLSVEHLAIILQKISEKGKICSCKFVIFSVAVCLCNMIQSLVVYFTFKSFHYGNRLKNLFIHLMNIKYIFWSVNVCYSLEFFEYFFKIITELLKE